MRERYKDGWSEEFQDTITVTETEVRASDGSLRVHSPEDVVGSLAFYHDTKKGIYSSKAEAEKYKRGKAFHLYRPKLTDALGRTSWAILQLNGNLLSIIFDPVWMDNAVYPVVLDPNFGYETAGTSSAGNINWAAGDIAAPAGAGTLDSTSHYIEEADDPGCSAKSAVYRQSDEVRIDYSDAQGISAAADWNTFPLNDGSITPVNYYIVVGVVTQPALWYFDFAEETSVYTNYGGSWLQPHPVGWNEVTDRVYSAYATYTAAGTQAFKDIATRFKLNVQSYQDISTRFLLTVGTLAYKDIATRYRLTVRGFEDIATRFKLTAQNYQDIATRFLLRVQGYKDVATRFRLWVQDYTDIATRFKLEVQNYRDITTRFRLIRYYFRDVSTRFMLAPPGVYRDIGTRFFLYVPTWKELQIQSELTELKDEVRVALEPKAHFRI